MRGGDIMEKVINKINILAGGFVAFFAGIFGDHWYLFAAFLVLNVVDYITGILKAKYFNIENSCKGVRGIIKKVGYWLCIAIGFFVSLAFGEMGTLIGVDLSFTVLFGWFTLATFIVNEIRSILENLLLMDVEIPSWLVKGLEIAKIKMDERNDINADN